MIKSAPGLIDELEQASHIILKQKEELSAEDLNFNPFGTAWSVLQVVEHITILDTLVLNKLEPVLKQTKGNAAKPHKFGFLERVFIGYIDPESKMKLYAPKMYKPPITSNLDAEETFTNYQVHQKRYKDIITLAEDCDQTKKVASPFTRFLRMSVCAWLHMGVLHQQRHILQIEKIRKKLSEQS